MGSKNVGEVCPRFHKSQKPQPLKQTNKCPTFPLWFHKRLPVEFWGVGGWGDGECSYQKQKEGKMKQETRI